MHARPIQSNPMPVSTDIHDIQALTATGTITLPVAPTSGRRASATGTNVTPVR